VHNSTAPESYIVDTGTELRAMSPPRTADALALYQLALLINVLFSPAYFHLGVMYYELGHREAALELYARTLTLKPDYTEALCNVGVIHKNSGNIDLAITYYQRALSVDANFMLVKGNMAIALTDLGTVHKTNGDLDRAAKLYKRALFYNSSYADAYYNLAIVYIERNEQEKALVAYELAIHFKPSYTEALNNLGAPTYSEAYNNLGVIYRDEGRVDDSIEAYDKCIHLNPTSVNAYHNNTNRPISIMKLNKRITIGYMSPDFFTHSVSFFIDGILKNHNKEDYDIICYSNVTKEDETTSRLQSYNHTWRNIVKMSDLDVAKLIAEDQVDIIVDLAGHTSSNRLDVLAYKPAPLAISYLGYPNTTGLPTIDYKLTDEYTDPLNTGQKFTEELYRLPRCFLNYTPPPFNLDITSPLDTNGYITFGSFNVISKYSDIVLQTWAKILHLVPNSKLYLKGKAFACPSTTATFVERMTHLGIDKDRTILSPLFANQREHLLSYNRMDISLDTFPYAGTTTTCESLWMGVPVITLAGNSHAHNVGRSIVKQLKMEAAESLQQYIDMAVALALDRDLLKSLKLTLRQRLLDSYLCDGALFTKSLEVAYKQMWTKRVMDDQQQRQQSIINTTAQYVDDEVV
ncbi:hypothetical protein SAMD00019534_043650, partial [Acytostelium subglobosum LB1]|uniref:hypothetical protein n=1 Tax=Acytostelium subglobosum LB1 TaxID=1410327 RepID=UPI000644B54B